MRGLPSESARAIARRRARGIALFLLGFAHAGLVQAASPLEFEPLQAAMAAPPYPTPALATVAAADTGDGSQALERFGVAVHSVEALNPAAELPITAVASTPGGGGSFRIEILWTPAGQESFPDEVALDLRVSIAPEGGRSPELRQLDTGSITRGLLATIAAELADAQGQLESVYASHFVEVATGPALDAALLDAEVAAVDLDPPLVRVAFRLAREGPGAPAPGEPIVVVTTTGTAGEAPAGVSALPVWGPPALAAALLGALACRARARRREALGARRTLH